MQAMEHLQVDLTRDEEMTGRGVGAGNGGVAWHTPTYHRARASLKLQDWKIKANKPMVFGEKLHSPTRFNLVFLF